MRWLQSDGKAEHGWVEEGENQVENADATRMSGEEAKEDAPNRPGKRGRGGPGPTTTTRLADGLLTIPWAKSQLRGYFTTGILLAPGAGWGAPVSNGRAPVA